MSKNLTFIDKVRVYKGYTTEAYVGKVENGHLAEVNKNKREGIDDTVVFFKAKHFFEDYPHWKPQEHRQTKKEQLEAFKEGKTVTVEGAMVIITVKER
ncbi:hypothetical protein LD13_gp217 [Bacillus phage Bobb]|uniref:Uncharacterized protein n=1 Tax=Bacillus phage Bobb TaxID=1527469 RepID=A0A076G739_9CAUD|nr:hypothetical protein LD13_gp217 [Bacillus phage Bobb]AII28132.1 hypothetical protein [Bacillus phage Bobb]